MVHASDEQPNGSAEILVVGGRSYAFGLRWTSAASRSTLDAEAKTAAVAERAGYVVIHRAYNQFGLASIGNAPTGLTSWFYRPRSGIAAVVLSAGAATLAAFPLDDDRWLVLAIDRKGFLPDGDMIVAGAEEARARIETLIAQSPTNWRRKFVPEGWGIPDTKTVNPEDLLSGSGAPRLVPFWFLNNRLRIRLGFAAAFALIVAAGIAPFRFAAAPPPAAVAAFQPPKPIAAVWTPAALSLDNCLSALRSAQRYNAVPGWRPAKYSCQGGESFVVDFVRVGNGQIGMMRSLLPQARLSDDGRAAVLAIALSTLPRISAIGSFSTREQYRVVGLDLSQRLNGTFTLQAGKKLLPGEPDATPANQAWKLFTWTYQTQAPALVWAGALSRLGSISLDTLVFTPAENLWQITGSVYASN
ncbi:MAG: pilin accessory family protein [Rhodospirillales bacterium]|nr:pilin accessory family protein [Rhodospirillales bacterium]